MTPPQKKKMYKISLLLLAQNTNMNKINIAYYICEVRSIMYVIYCNIEIYCYESGWCQIRITFSIEVEKLYIEPHYST